MIASRIIATLVLLIGLILFPWYVEAVLCIVACCFFVQYYEILLIGAVFSIVSPSPLYLPLTLAGMAIVLIEYIKTKLAFAY